MLQTVLQMHAYKYDISIWTYTRCTSRNDFRSVLVENTTNSRRNARWQVQHSIYMFMHFPYSLQYAVLVHVHFGSMVLLLVLMLLAVLVLERWKRATLASKALRSGRPGATPKKVNKNTPFRTFHTLVRVMNAIQSYISTSYMTSIFFALKANEVDKSARWSQNVPRS